jgi:hypothetical protein
MASYSVIGTIIDSPQQVCLLGILAVIVHLLLVRYRTDLYRVPGPFFARFLCIDRLITAASDILYHEKYGPLVRVGPNHVSVSDTNCIPQLYGIATKLKKYYKLFSH